MRVRRRFLATSIVFVVFWTAISVAVTRNLVQIRQQFDKIIAQNVEAVFALQELYGETARMREEAASAALLLLLGAEPEADEAFAEELMELSEAHQESLSWLDVYRNVAADHDNQSRFGVIASALDDTYTISLEIIDAAQQNDAERVESLKEELEELENALVAFATQAIEDERSSLRDSEGVVATFALRSAIVFGSVILVLIVVITFGTLRFARAVLTPLDAISKFAITFHPEEHHSIPSIEPPNALHRLHQAVEAMARRTTDLTRDLRERNQKLEKSMALNQMLIREVHHRVKNNLQVVISMLNLQAGSETSELAREHLDKARSRLYAVALVHKLLYSSADQTEVRLDHYLPTLVSAIETAIDETGERFRIEAEVDPCSLDVDLAIHVGLIINELVANAFKHAIRDDTPCLVQLRFACVDGRAVLTVRDNGQGLAEDFRPEHAESLGLQIVSVTAAQLDGVVEFSNDDGLVVTISFPLEPQ